jgi:hypothetical protein
MSPLQKIAMGLVIVVGRAVFPPSPSPDWEVYDALPDPLGWLLVIAGSVGLARTDAGFGAVRWLAALAGLVSVPMWFPQVNHLLDASGEWFVSLPQLVFCLVLAMTVGRAGADRDLADDYVAKRFGLLVWGFALLAALPVVALGGEVTWLEDPTRLFSVVVNVALVYLLFRVHRREWLGGPGPLEIGIASRP